MGVTPINNPPAPVLNTIAVAIHDPLDCAALKDKFQIETRKHKKGCPKTSGNESHHILQDSAMKKLISKYSGHALVLAGASGGEHDVINASQTGRNCPTGMGGGQGPATFGELQIAARDDLKKGLANRTDENGNKPTPGELQQLSECLVIEAVAATQENREENNKPLIKKGDAVEPVMGCFAMGTLVWLFDDVRVRVEDIQPGRPMHAANGPAEVVRADACRARLVRVVLPEGDVRLAGDHRVHLASGRRVRAANLKEGSLVLTARGVRRIASVHLEDATSTVVNFGIGRADACRVGEAGLWVELRDLGWPMGPSVDVLDAAEPSEAACQR